MLRNKLVFITFTESAGTMSTNSVNYEVEKKVSMECKFHEGQDSSKRIIKWGEVIKKK